MLPEFSVKLQSTGPPQARHTPSTIGWQHRFAAAWQAHERSFISVALAALAFPACPRRP
jgi:hypothetical protein